MRKRLMLGASALLLAVIALGSTPASACGSYGYGYGYGCGCPGYGYAYYARPAYAYYYAAPVYYARPAYAYYSPHYSRGWAYGPRAYYGWRGGRRW
jgi:hypothetical protein